MSDCIENCPICGGDGYVFVGTAAMLCKNNPATFAGGGVVYEDLAVPDLLPKTSALNHLLNAVGELTEAGYGMLYIVGEYGVGKTVVAKATTAKLLQKGVKALYTRQSQMMTYLRSAYDEQSGQKAYAERIKQYCQVDWLVIDELGRDRMTDFARESLAEIIDARYQGSVSKHNMTVLISNDKPETILQPYLVDRIRDVKNKVLIIKGESLRGK